MLELTVADFDAHPVWYDVVDDDDIVVAWDGAVDLHEGVYYCKADFTFADGTTAVGFIRIVDNEVLSIAVWRADRGFVDYALLEDISAWVGPTADQFAALLGRSSDHVFPLRYRSNIHDAVIAGQIDQSTRRGRRVTRSPGEMT
ncbi:MAG: hypothetical protein NZ518_09260 [Dehalococcoidia bacterium]|nr:hypothetical protein [Dehalococcoidia bacterium]